ncbi:metal ABC transporter ATP-binding protein [Brachyspira hyodysenteriae]|uniref:metal ABC transporter ATP-binding protein n=1 Tax=Brachyspira hyodysenteriae TaxID=159 RepID=UPI00063DC965|nr:metal ABC transporter ATP-binding protein [Brachyspira hyodysenteriae]KLI14654.1 ABC transporter [Brachyspira hyodysenteriae]MBT8718855.1 metal ABC transporter ATP-binding protein [Brachyspira hyodysenteriae]MBT8728962.1 metal ABC transporter ATP-binding protein [Brachyspira hyodysenteriae]MBT8731679.1 metal ABC transporter ATP-binding protein [Brachyspira hyodysenteriae]MBT8734261.1 metal ABC transporter ATP-binding protein [Brachyspira hyodysenteriae]
MSKIIEFKNVHFGYTSDDILKCISFDVNKGDFVSIIGSNGVGKSTILKLILGDISQFRGSIKLYEEDINKFRDWKRIGYLEQNAYSKIINFPATVYEIVMSNNFADIGLFKFPNKSHHVKVIKALELLGMEKYKNRMISKLSGGQIQRVFLARTLISEPDLLVLDEPTNGVDRETIDLIYKILQDLNKEKKVTIIMVTHDVEKTSNISNRIFCFEEGSLVELEKKQIYDELSHKHKHPNSDHICSC